MLSYRNMQLLVHFFVFHHRS
uniref:Uncharacterized protein n=1 Tax=Arundo donax TaxID=35708 RepID=A0A0A9AWH1_ARUDO